VALQFDLISEGRNKVARQLFMGYDRKPRMQLLEPNQRVGSFIPASLVEVEKKRQNQLAFDEALQILAGNDCGKTCSPSLITLARLEFEMPSTEMSVLAAASSPLSPTSRESCRATLKKIKGWMKTPSPR
jgi:hypothetical protein